MRDGAGAAARACFGGWGLTMPCSLLPASGSRATSRRASLGLSHRSDLFVMPAGAYVVPRQQRLFHPTPPRYPFCPPAAPVAKRSASSESWRSASRRWVLRRRGREGASGDGPGRGGAQRELVGGRCLPKSRVSAQQVAPRTLREGAGGRAPQLSFLPPPLHAPQELKAYMASRGKKVGEGEKLDAKAINQVGAAPAPAGRTHAACWGWSGGRPGCDAAAVRAVRMAAAPGPLCVRCLRAPLPPQETDAPRLPACLPGCPPRAGGADRAAAAAAGAAAQAGQAGQAGGRGGAATRRTGAALQGPRRCRARLPCHCGQRCCPVPLLFRASILT